MKKLTKHLFPSFGVLGLLALGLSAAPLTPFVGDDDDDDDDELELDEAEVFIEFNSTDGDFGIQFFWDGEAWDRMKCEGPNERTVLRVKAARNLAAHGLTEGFFESNEPSADELTMEEFFDRFPEGEYEYEGRTLEGDEIEGETEFTHVLPAPPTNFFTSDGSCVDAAAPLTVSFDAVTTDLDGAPLVPEQYEVVIEVEDGELERVLSVILAGDECSPALDVPSQFLKPGLEYKLEVIVQEESGNRTIAETIFETF